MRQLSRSFSVSKESQNMWLRAKAAAARLAEKERTVMDAAQEAVRIKQEEAAAAAKVAEEEAAERALRLAAKAKLARERAAARAAEEAAERVAAAAVEAERKTALEVQAEDEARAAAEAAEAERAAAKAARAKWRAARKEAARKQEEHRPEWLAARERAISNTLQSMLSRLDEARLAAEHGELRSSMGPADAAAASEEATTAEAWAAHCVDVAKSASEAATLAAKEAADAQRLESRAIEAEAVAAAAAARAAEEAALLVAEAAAVAAEGAEWQTLRAEAAIAEAAAVSNVPAPMPASASDANGSLANRGSHAATPAPAELTSSGVGMKRSGLLLKAAVRLQRGAQGHKGTTSAAAGSETSMNEKPDSSAVVATDSATAMAESKEGKQPVKPMANPLLAAPREVEELATATAHEEAMLREAMLRATAITTAAESEADMAVSVVGAARHAARVAADSNAQAQAAAMLAVEDAARASAHAEAHASAAAEAAAALEELQHQCPDEREDAEDGGGLDSAWASGVKLDGSLQALLNKATRVGVEQAVLAELMSNVSLSAADKKRRLHSIVDDAVRDEAARLEADRRAEADDLGPWQAWDDDLDF